MISPDPKITSDMIDYDDFRVASPYVIEALTVYMSDDESYRIEIMFDTDSTPFDADCYTEDDVEAWRNDQWRFAGVIVTPLYVPEARQFELSDSLWGLEFMFPLDPRQEHDGRTYSYTDENYLTMVYPVPSMIDNVRRMVKKGGR